MIARHGVGLVELLVAMALGLAVVTLVMQTELVHARVAVRAATTARSTDNAATAMALLQAHVALAGRAVARGVDLPASAPPRLTRLYGGPSVRACAHGFVQPRAAFDALVCASGPPGTPGGLALRWEADATSTPLSSAGRPLDCLGNGVAPEPAASGQPVHWVGEARFYLAVPAGGSRRELYCATPGSAAPQALVEGIDDLQVEVALPSSGMLAWQPPAAVAVASWADVVAVRLCLVAASENEPAGAPLPYLGCDDAWHTPADRRMRQVLRAAVPLRQGAGRLP